MTITMTMVGLCVLGGSLFFLYLGFLSLFKKDLYTDSKRLEHRLGQILGEGSEYKKTDASLLLKPDQASFIGANWYSTLGFAIPRMWGRALYQWIAQRTRRIQCEQQLPEVLNGIARALRAGHSLSVALTLSAQDAAEPMGGELRLALDALHYGRSLEDCLHHLSDRLPGTDLRFVVIAILVQRETGGNLADLLDRVAHTLRARMLLKSFIQSQAAEGKMSAWILSLLPVFLLLWTAWASPHAMHIFLHDPLGQRLMASAVMALFLGTLWVWHLTRIRQ
jgi:Flp pilus assembly protein TadB